MDLLELLSKQNSSFKITICAILFIILISIINKNIKSNKHKLREIYFTNNRTNRKYYVNDEYFQLLDSYIKLNKETIHQLRNEIDNLKKKEKIEEYERIKKRVDMIKEQE